MLKKGDLLPKVSLEDHNGKNFKLDLLKGQPAVVFFYPKDETPGCVAEVCAFRDNYQDFMDLGAKVIGISGDSVKSHAKFVQKRNLPYPLLSDTKRIAERAFGVKRNFLGLIPGRVSFVFDSEGKLIHSFSSQGNPTGHMHQALRKIKNLVN